MKALKILLAMVLMFTGLNLWSQIAINADGSDPHSSAMLDVQSNNSGVLIPRMTAAERDAIPSPANGLMVFITDVNQFYYYDQGRAGWMPMGSGGTGGSGWQIDGTDMYSIVSGNIGVGSTSPGSKLHISSDNSAWGMVRIQNSNSGTNEACLSFIDGNETPFSDYWMMGVGVYGNAGDFIIGRGGMGGEKLKIDYDGNVGIGTSSIDGENGLLTKTKNGEKTRALSHRLTIANLADMNVLRLVGPNEPWGYGARLNFGDENYVFIEEDEDDKLNIRANRVSFSEGVVGIGTQTPWGNLDIRGWNIDEGATIQMGNNDLTHKIQFFSGDNTTPNPYMLWSYGNHLRFITNENGGTEMMRITSDGNVGIGTLSPSEKLTVRGNILVESSTGEAIVEIGEGLDFAEGFDVSDAFVAEPGTVLILDPDNPGELKVATEAYDSRVAGIVAGANSLGSGVKLGSGQFDCDVALAGRVYCKVDATSGEVKVGDLLTTSTTPGYAMVVKKGINSSGAILGKAMQNLEKGKRSEILVLVTLQ